MPDLRLTGKDAYTSDIGKLRDAIRANGTRPNILVVDVKHAQGNFSMHLYAAYQSNSAFAGIPGSLYTLAFTNPQGTWRFNDALGAGITPTLFPGNPSGSYASLNCPLALPMMTQANLGAACAAVATYNGGVMTNAIKENFAFMLVVGSEAIRSTVVELDVRAVIGGGANVPNWAVLHNWGGNRLG